MTVLLKLLSLLTVIAIVLTPLLYLFGEVDHAAVKSVALVSTLAWFCITPTWMGRHTPQEKTA